MKDVQEDDIGDVIESGSLPHDSVEQVADGPEVVGIHTRIDERDEETRDWEFAGKSEIVKVVVLEVAFISAPVGDEEADGEKQEEQNDPTLTGHGPPAS
jgi:hypothetical protein